MFVIFLEQKFPRLQRRGNNEHAQTYVFLKMFLGLPGKETLIPARLPAQGTFWETTSSRQCFLVCKGLNIFSSIVP